MIFVDASAWAAAALPKDRNHRAAVDWVNRNTSRLVTTDYVIDEVPTLLLTRGERMRALEIGIDLLEKSENLIHWVTQDDARSAWEVFQKFDDKEWSFTDCVSRVVMEQLGIKQAFAFDDHFRQFGSVSVVPE